MIESTSVVTSSKDETADEKASLATVLRCCSAVVGLSKYTVTDASNWLLEENLPTIIVADGSCCLIAVSSKVMLSPRSPLAVELSLRRPLPRLPQQPVQLQPIVSITLQVNNGRTSAQVPSPHVRAQAVSSRTMNARVPK